MNLICECHSCIGIQNYMCQKRSFQFDLTEKNLSKLLTFFQLVKCDFLSVNIYEIVNYRGMIVF